MIILAFIFLYFAFSAAIWYIIHIYVKAETNGIYSADTLLECVLFDRYFCKMYDIAIESANEEMKEEGLFSEEELQRYYIRAKYRGWVLKILCILSGPMYYLFKFIVKVLMVLNILK